MTASSSGLAWIRSVTVKDKFPMFSIFTPTQNVDDDGDGNAQDDDDDSVDEVEPHCDRVLSHNLYALLRIILQRWTLFSSIKIQGL